jgi:hydrogenase expression/formation protein HypC
VNRPPPGQTGAPPVPRCVTCADEAVPGRVLAVLADGQARVETADAVLQVDVSLVDATVGDTVLVHAGVAIGKRT